MSTPEYASAADVAALAKGLTDLQAALEDLREAQTPRQRKDAADDVNDARGDLDAVAARLGITKEALTSAAAEAKKAKHKEELRPILVELLEEINNPDSDDGDPDDAGDGGDPPPAPKPPKAKPAPKPKAKAAPDPADGGKPDPADKPDDAPPPDAGPVVDHWSDRSVGSLLK